MPRRTAPPTSLPYPYEGLEVTKMAVKVMKTGDGLSEPLDVEPSPGAIGQERYIVLRTITRDIDHRPPGPMANDLVRIETDVCQEAYIVDRDDVYDILETRRKRVAEVKGEPMFEDTGSLNPGEDDGNVSQFPKAPQPDAEAEAAWSGDEAAE